MNRFFAFLLLTWATLTLPPRKDERGLSQSTENAVLLAGAAALAATVLVTVGAYVTKNLPK